MAEEIAEVRVLAERHTVFERGDSLLDVTFVEIQLADTMIRKDKARWVRDRLGNADTFVTTGDPLGKFAQLGKARDYAGTGGNRERSPNVEVRIEQLPFEERQVSP